jgi:hypothetical protein
MLCDGWGRVTTYCAATDVATSPNRLQTIEIFEYQMKILLSSRHLAPNLLKIDDFGDWRPVFPLKIFLKSRLRQSNQGQQYSYLHLVPFRRRNSMYLLYMAGISN